MKDKFAFFEASKNPIPKRRKLLAKCQFLQATRALFEPPFKLDRVSFSTPEKIPFKTRVGWPLFGLFFGVKVILTSEGYLLKLTLKDS